MQFLQWFSLPFGNNPGTGSWRTQSSTRMSTFELTSDSEGKQYGRTGFTLIELMIALAMVSILLFSAVPSVTNMIKNNRLTSQANSIVTDIHFARSEAVKRSAVVIMCRSANPNATTPSCGGTEKSWTDGYLIFADDGTYINTVYDAGTDILLRRGQPAAFADVVMHTNSAWDENLKFTHYGNTDESGSTAIMTICDARGAKHGRQISVMPSGIPLAASIAFPDCTL